MLLYLTPHNVVSTLYARNTRGQLDAYRVYTATDWRSAREIVERRGIEIIVVCMDQEIYPGLSDEPDSFESRLRRGEAPPWLTPVELSGAAAIISGCTGPPAHSRFGSDTQRILRTTRHNYWFG